MKTKDIVSQLLILLSLCGVAFADKQLERTEVLQIFQKLTNQPRKTWIPAGTIEATHEEYKAPKEVNTNTLNSQINKEIQQYLSDANKKELSDVSESGTV
ncbi:MAG: hypothetical protein WAK60_00395 [Sedimentisphaerales bacterium]